MLGKKKKAARGSDDRVLLQNSVKTLVANIRFASIDNPVSVIAVTSSIPSEGKSTISLALAQALAASGKSVLLVDCDLRRRALANMIGSHAQYGIYSVLAGQASLDEATVETDTRGLYFLDCEPHIPNPVDILASRRFKALVEQMRQEFGYVVIDTPPLSAFVDGAVISQNADGTLLVVRRDFAKRDEVLASYDQLRKADANVLGTVLNYCESEKSEYYYSYYNKDGKRVRKSGGSSQSAPKMPDVPLSQRAVRPAQPARPAQAARSVAPAQAQAQTPAPEPVPAGLKPLPEVEQPADSTMAFLKQSGYQPRAGHSK